ncbi:MAG: anoctamin, partial [Thaumarchaeota archaeon]|nr:anoctamin [Nitrososphaerota archaeon]
TATKVQSELNGKQPHPKDAPEEAAFLARVRNEAALDVYDVTVDYREMVIQYGRWPPGGLVPSVPLARALFC